MVNGPPCSVCGYPLRWFGEQNAWGCDRCQRLFPAAPQQAQGQAPARKKSAMPWVAGAVVAIGGIVAIAVAAGGGGGNKNDRNALVIESLESARDAMCACTDDACVRNVLEGMDKTRKAFGTGDSLSSEQKAQMKAIFADIEKCTSKVAGGVPSSPDPRAAAPATTGAVGADGLPAECDQWKAEIDKLAACPKVSAQIADAQKQAYQRSTQAWSSLPAESKPQLASSCKQLADGIAQLRAQICGG